MQNLILRIVLAIVVYIVIGILGTMALEEVCYPAYSHGTVSLSCNFALYTPIYASVAVGIITGLRINYYSLLWGLVASSIGLVILFRGFYTHWYGSDFQNILAFIIFWNLAPAIISAFIISSYHVYNNR